MNGIEALLEVLAAHGVRYIFGNPGSTELPLNEALAGDQRFQYVLGLHEVALTSMADGYALASGDLGVACVHICCGLGNSMGMLYNAHCEGSPLLLLAGQQDTRLRFGEPVLAGDMVSVARPWTKWAYEVQRVNDLPAAVRRAVQTALTPPTGPVFLSVPVDLQRQPVGSADLAAPSLPNRRVRPPLEAVAQAAELLVLAQRPAILAGSRLTEAGAVDELTQLAEALGTPVLTESTAAQGRRPMAADHPLYAGPVSMWAPEVNQRLRAFDVMLAVGADLFRLYIHREPAEPLPPGLRLIQLDACPETIGRSYPVEIGLLGDPQAGLAELLAQVRQRQTPSQRRAAARRGQAHAALRATVEAVSPEAEQAPAGAAAAPLSAAGAGDSAAGTAGTESTGDHGKPLSLEELVDALAAPLPANAAVVEEALTTHYSLLERRNVPRDPAAYFGHRGWALGWGLGCATGVKLAWPQRPVVALLGDGSALFGIQGLWTAAHYRIPVTFVVANNAQYGILKMGGKVMGLPRLSAGQHVGIDLLDPEVDFVALSRSLGVPAFRVRDAADLSARVDAAVRGDGPVLLDVPVER